LVLFTACCRRIQCAAESPVKWPNTILPRNTPARIDKKYPTFIVMTAIILNELASRMLKLKEYHDDLQQVANPSENHIHRS
jgi:hypothetical protein